MTEVIRGKRVPESNYSFWVERIIKLVGSSLDVDYLQGIGVPVDTNNISLQNLIMPEHQLEGPKAS